MMCTIFALLLQTLLGENIPSRGPPGVMFHSRTKFLPEDWLSHADKVPSGVGSIGKPRGLAASEQLLDLRGRRTRISPQIHARGTRAQVRTGDEDPPAVGQLGSRRG